MSRSAEPVAAPAGEDHGAAGKAWYGGARLAKAGPGAVRQARHVRASRAEVRHGQSSQGWGGSGQPGPLHILRRSTPILISPTIPSGRQQGLTGERGDDSD